MKKVTFTLSLIFSLFISTQVMSQACPGGSSSCQAAGGPQGGGFEDPASTACAVQGTAYNEPIEFTMFSVFDFLGTQNVDSIEFLTIDNLPCGLCWAVDQADKRYTKGEDGCLNISGTTYDAAGQYKMALSLKAWINNGPNPQTIPSSLVDQTGIKILLRVKTPTGVCVNADTSASANNLTAGTCNVGINEMAADFSALQMSPNPVTNRGTLSFLSQKNVDYSLRVTDVTGKVVSVNTIEAKTGINTTTIERNDLPAGVYFITLTDGKSNLTQRFSIAE